MTLVITTGWVLALVIVFSVRNVLPADVRWWVWTCVTGVVMGLFGLWYVPFLKRRRARIAAERARLSRGSALLGVRVPGQRLEDGLLDRDAGQVHQVVAELVDHRGGRLRRRSR